MKTAKKKLTIRKKPSGAFYRKARQQRLIERGEPGKSKRMAAMVVTLPHVGRLKTVNDWLTQIAKIYRRTVSGTIPVFVGTKLTYIATEGGKLAKLAEENEILRDMYTRLLQTNGQPGTQDLLPATINEDEGDEK